MFSENNVAAEHKKVTQPNIEDAEAVITRRILDNLTSKETQSSILETIAKIILPVVYMFIILIYSLLVLL